MTTKADFNIVDVDWWQERDRASVVVFDNENRRATLWEAWDEEVYELIEDGFIKWHDDSSVLDYLEDVGVLEHEDDEAYWRDFERSLDD